MTASTPHPRVHVIALGGTIASTSRSTETGVTPGLSGDDLVSAVPSIAAHAEITTEQLAQVGSASLTIEKIVEVCRAGKAALDDGAAGVIVTQGTDSLEETAFILSMLHDGARPFVVTGAMRNPTLPGADGPANLLASVLVACSWQSEGLGAVAVFNDEIHDPVYVRKTHTSSTAAFSSQPAMGPIGWVVEDEVEIAHRPARRATIATPAGDIAPVALVPSVLGDDLRTLDGLHQLGYAGAVIAGMGGGHIPEFAVERAERLASYMPVVMASRTGSGRGLRRTYDYPGSELDLASRGMLPAGVLDGRKARLALSLLLSSGDATTIGDRWRAFVKKL